MNCLHPQSRQKFVARSEKVRMRVLHYVDSYICLDCGREQARLVVNPQSVTEVEAAAAMARYRTRAARMLRDAVSAGLIEKPSKCEHCAATKDIQGHHYDYARPLEVEWLCPACHKSADKARAAAEAA